jgi:hypothetical protein
MNEALLLKEERLQAGTLGSNDVNASVYCMFPPYEDALFCRVSTNVNLRETLVFKCDDEGKVLNWGELFGMREILPHDEVLIAMGYQIRNP